MTECLLSQRFSRMAVPMPDMNSLQIEDDDCGTLPSVGPPCHPWVHFLASSAETLLNNSGMTFLSQDRCRTISMALRIPLALRTVQV
jgi:hypothetical protein